MAITQKDKTVTSDVSLDRLADIVERALNAIGETVGCAPEKAVETLSSALSPSTTGKKTKTKKVGFTLMAVYLFAAVMYQLTQNARVRCSFKGKSSHLKAVKAYASAFFRRYGYQNSEYLVDFYASSSERALCPLITMESEATEESKKLEFHDFQKLLSVSSPRRLYLFRTTERRLPAVVSRLGELLDEAYKSQILLRGDEVVAVIHVTSRSSSKFETYSFDAAARMGHISTHKTPLSINS